MSSNYTEFKRGWPVVVASAVGIGLGMSPLPFYTIGVFAGPLVNEFGWGLDQVMLALPVFTFAAIFMSPLVGHLTDRFGARRVALTSVFLFSLAMMSFSLMDGSLEMYLGIWVLLAVCGAGTLPITWTRAVNGWFFHRRGLALGLSLVGTGLFGLIAKQYAWWLIELVGWRMAYVGVGALPLMVAWPVAFFLFREAPEEQVDDEDMAAESPPVRASSGGLSLGEAVKDWRFWLLAYSFVPISFAVGGPIPNLETMMAGKGFTVGDAVTLASLIGAAVVFGRVIGGYLLDRFWAPAIAAILLSVPAVATFILAQPDLQFWLAAVAIMVLGMAAGVEYDLMAYLVSRYFGLKHYSAIYGALYAFFALGAGVGPYVYAAAFEATGSYDKILILSSFLFIAGALPILLLGKYRDVPV